MTSQDASYSFTNKNKHRARGIPVKAAGTVTDENGQPMPGVSVSVKGTTTGTVTDINGDYSLDVPQGSRIELSFIGYKPIEIKAGANSNIRLQPDNKLLNEVVVVGYGTMKKSDLTGSVTEINDKNFNKGVVTSPSQMLQGRIAGINVTNNGGEPGGGVTIRVRGSNSIRSGQDPLWVIDGVPLDASTSLQADGGSIQGVSSTSYTNPLNYLNPDDIESISVLKDASAAAIYGSRAANGVILITTRRTLKVKPGQLFRFDEHLLSS
jgi:TonB-dependent SusC/RagA subfamily outer membrane receptor